MLPKVAKKDFDDMTANPNSVDIHVGGRARLQRTLQGMS